MMASVIAWFRERILRSMYPILKWLSEIYPERLVNADFVKEVLSKIQPGDVLVTRENMVMTNFFIPGFWTHALIYVGDGMIVEATGIGVHTTPLEKLLYSKDHVAVLRPKFADAVQCALAVNEAKSLEGDPYDYDFTGDNRAFYCAEVIWYAYDQAMKPAPSPFTKRITWGVQTVTPQDFYQATDKFDLIAKFGGPQ
jgi:uncharacterized protein YycO